MVDLFDILIQVVSFSIFDGVSDAATYSVQEVILYVVILALVWYAIKQIIMEVIGYAGFDV